VKDKTNWRALAAVLLIGALAMGAMLTTGQTPLGPLQAAAPAAPIRAAFYYPWYPETTFGKYTPSTGAYDSSDDSVIRQHIYAMQYAGIQVGISSWWGQGTTTDDRLMSLLQDSSGSTFKWTAYYEPAGNGPQTDAAIDSDLTFLYSDDALDPAWLHVNGKPVLFVYNASGSNCTQIAQWVKVNAGRFYLNMKVFAGYASCSSQPDSWHQYGPDVPASPQLPYSYSVSPGFDKYTEAAPRLVRDPTRFAANVKAMIASNAQWQLITTFNEWGEGTAVESSTVWGDVYLDILHNNGVYASPTPAPTVPPSASPTATATGSPSPTGSATASPSASPTASASPSPTPKPSPTPTVGPTPTPSGSPGLTLTVDAISDGGPASSNWTNYGTRMAADNPAALLWAGDVRMTGTAAEWKLFDAVYGRFHLITVPTPGNHDWGNAPIGYNQEFNGDPYADTVSYCNAVTLSNGWQIFSINTYTRSTCLPALTAWLNGTPGTKKIVITHEPRFSGGSGHGSSTAQAPIWDAMAGHAIVLFSGHDHDSQVIESGGRVQVVNGCAGAAYYSVSPLTGEVYYSKSAADCSYDRFILGPTSITVQAIHLDGTVAFSKSYAVTG
jgi:hypothetical protein